MHDPAYKLLFSRPRMIRDLLEGFAARGWSGALDFDSLDPVPASFVSHDLRQRHGDLVWRVRFGGDRWLYLMLLLEFQSTVDPAMAARMLTYTGLLYQRLAADGVLGERGVLPPVLPVVLYNGRRRWTAAVEMNDLVAGAEPPLAPYQASQRYYLLDAGRTADADLPSGNLVSALVGLEKGRGRARLRAPLLALIDLLEAQADEELRRAFAAWVTQMLRAPGRPPAKDLDSLARLKETYTMLEENVREWTREWVEEGRTRGLEEGRTRGIEEGRTRGIEEGRTRGIEEGRTRGIEEGRTRGIEEGRTQGIEQGRGEERALLCRLAARKFDAAAGETLAAALAGVADPERLGRVGDWIIECATASELLARVRGDGRSGG